MSGQHPGALGILGSCGSELPATDVMSEANIRRKCYQKDGVFAVLEQAIPAKHPEARKQHFNPKCWLAGFTDTGQQDGRLWVTDLKRRKQWPTSPPNAGHRRDFYRVSAPGLSPLVFEKAFGEIETAAAPVFRSLYDRPRAPTREELECLLLFIAVQYVRVPAFRPWVLKIADSIHRSRVAKALKSPTSWARALKKAGIPADDPAAAYNRMLEFEQRGEYSLSAENEWYLMRGFDLAVDCVTPALRARYWGSTLSPSGSFIGSDTPVAMDGPKGQLAGFESADIVLFPVNRHVLLYGTKMAATPPAVNRKLVARYNTFAMLTAGEHLYSHVPDFCWLDEEGKCQTDWALFSKEKVLSHQ